MNTTPHVADDFEKYGDPVPLFVTDDSKKSLHKVRCKRCGVYGAIVVQVFGHARIERRSDEMAIEFAKGVQDVVERLPVCPDPSTVKAGA